MVASRATAVDAVAGLVSDNDTEDHGEHEERENAELGHRVSIFQQLTLDTVIMERQTRYRKWTGGDEEIEDCYLEALLKRVLN